MNIDLTQEEINLITSIFDQAALSMNRQSMIGYVNITGGIINKFQLAATPIPETLKEGE